MEVVVRELAVRNGLNDGETEDLVQCLPTTWVRHGDLILLPWTGGMGGAAGWEWLLSPSGKEAWQAIAGILKCSRIVVHEKIANDR